LLDPDEGAAAPRLDADDVADRSAPIFMPIASFEQCSVSIAQSYRATAIIATVYPIE
jgi:hypothetical protein